MKKTNIAIAALSALLLTGYSGCFDSTNTTRGMKEDAYSVKNRIAEEKRDLKTKAKHGAGKVTEKAGKGLESVGKTFEDAGETLEDTGSEWEAA